MVQGLANGQKYPASTVYPFTGLQAEQLYRQEGVHASVVRKEKEK
jgi:hypothetical protein